MNDTNSWAIFGRITAFLPEISELENKRKVSGRGKGKTKNGLHTGHLMSCSSNRYACLLWTPQFSAWNYFPFFNLGLHKIKLGITAVVMKPKRTRFLSCPDLKEKYEFSELWKVVRGCGGCGDGFLTFQRKNFQSGSRCDWLTAPNNVPIFWRLHLVFFLTKPSVWNTV